MSFDNLFRQLVDIQYQADKILKSKNIEEDAIEDFAKYSENLKSRLLSIELNEELTIHVNDIEPIDPKLNPKPPIVTTILGALSFGVATKRYRSKKRQEYFRENVMATKNQYSFIDTLLKES